MRIRTEAFMRQVRRLARDARGSTATEYVMIATFVSIGILLALPLLGSNLASAFFGPASMMFTALGNSV